MNTNVKRIFAVVMTVVVSVFAFVGCSNNTEDETTASTIITTAPAVIKDSDAVDLIKTYTAEELQLNGSLDDYKIMVNNSGHQIDGKYYIKVIASKVSEPDADGRVTIDTYGQYFINYDGSEILIYNETDDTYTPVADVHEVPESATEAYSHSHDE